jgi:hypothetical protein
MRVIKVQGSLFDVFVGEGFETHSRVLIGRSYVQHVSGVRLNQQACRRLLNINPQQHYQDA